jgi:hypothetical protein
MRSSSAVESNLDLRRTTGHGLSEGSPFGKAAAGGTRAQVRKTEDSNKE